MLSALCSSAARIRELRDHQGPFGPLLERFAGHLQRSGYSSISARRHLRSAGIGAPWRHTARGHPQDSIGGGPSFVTRVVRTVDARATRNVRRHTLQLQSSDLRSDRAVRRGPRSARRSAGSRVHRRVQPGPQLVGDAALHDRAAHVVALPGCPGPLPRGPVGGGSDDGALAAEFAAPMPAAGRCGASDHVVRLVHDAGDPRSRHLVAAGQTGFVSRRHRRVADGRHRLEGGWDPRLRQGAPRGPAAVEPGNW